MANTCITSYVVSGPSEQISELLDIIRKSPKDKDRNGNPLNLINDLIESLGGTNEESRGVWHDLSHDIIPEENGNARIEFMTETAWNRREDLERAINERFPDAETFFLEEELGCEIFQTNDSEGTYFKETVIIDREDSSMEYYTEEDALKELSETAGHPIMTWEEAEAFCDSHNEKEDYNNGTEHIWLHKADIL